MSLKLQRVQEKDKKESESSDDSESENVQYTDSDDSASLFVDGCPGCGITAGGKKDWVVCNKCPTWWHKWCPGENELVNMPYKQIVKYNFICMLCQ